MAKRLTQTGALRAVCEAVIEAVRVSGPMGAPGGTIYMGLMQVGCSLNQYEQIMAALVQNGFLRRDGECYHLTGKTQ